MFIKKILSTISKSIKTLSRKSFIRNVFIVASGTAMAQVITMLFSPIITRIYGPEIYGIFGVFMSITAIFVPITVLTYPTAIVLPKRDSEARGLVQLSLYTTIIVSIIVLLIFILFGNPIVEFFKIKEVAPFLVFIPLTMFFGGILQIVNQWLIRKQYFTVKAKIAVIQSLVLNISYSGLGLLHPVAMTLVIVATLGQGLYALMLTLGSRIVDGVKKDNKEDNKEDDLNKGLTSPLALAKKYKEFPLYRAPQVFLHGISESLPVLMLSVFFGPASAAFYAIGMKVLGVPTNLIGNSVGDVFYPRIAQGANNGENISKLLFKANFSLALVGLIPYGIIIIFGQYLFSFVFGAEWSVAGIYAGWLAMFSYFIFITRPTIKTLQVLGEQRFHLIFTIITIVVRLIGLLIGSYVFNSDTISIAIYSIIGATLYCFLAVITLIKGRAKNL